MKKNKFNIYEKKDKMRMNKRFLQGCGEQETSPRDVKENGGSERAAELRSEDRRLKEIRGGYT